MDNHELVRLTGQRRPSLGFFDPFPAFLRECLAMMASSMPRSANWSVRESVVAPIEPQRPDLANQSPLGDHIESGCEEVDIVDIGSADTPAKGNAGAVSGDRPLPAALGPVHRLFPVPSPPAGDLWTDPSTATSEKSSPMILS